MLRGHGNAPRPGGSLLDWHRRGRPSAPESRQFHLRVQSGRPHIQVLGSRPQSRLAPGAGRPSPAGLWEWPYLASLMASQLQKEENAQI